MRLTMRLYKRHDIDLLCLYKQPNFSLQKTIKKAVLSYLDGNDEPLPYPDCNADLSDLPSTAQFHLQLSPKNEDDLRIYECISKIPSGFKNSFVKNITRHYVARPAVFAFQGKRVQIKAERSSFFDELQV